MAAPGGKGKGSGVSRQTDSTVGKARGGRNDSSTEQGTTFHRRKKSDLFTRHAEGYRKMYEQIVDEMIAQMDAPSTR